MGAGKKPCTLGQVRAKPSDLKLQTHQNKKKIWIRTRDGKFIACILLFRKVKKLKNYAYNKIQSGLISRHIYVTKTFTDLFGDLHLTSN